MLMESACRVKISGKGGALSRGRDPAFPVVTILAAIKRPAYFPVVTFDRIEPVTDVGFYFAVETVPAVPATIQREVLPYPRTFCAGFSGYSTGGVFGAVLVKDGKIVSEGMNWVVASHDPIK